MKKTILLIFTACADRINQIEESEESGYMYYPFKSAILTYQQENDESLYKKVKIWDNSYKGN